MGSTKALAKPWKNSTFEALRGELVQIGHVRAAVAVPLGHRVVERPVPRGHGGFGLGRELDVTQALGDAHVVGVDHAGHAVAHGPQVADVGVDEGGGVERPRPGAGRSAWG